MEDKLSRFNKLRIILLTMTKVYNKLLEQYPLTTKASTSGALFSIGDFFTQFIFEKKEFSWKRNFDFFVMGFGYIAPALHLWYCNLLPRLAAKVFPATVSKPVRVFGSMLFDQLMFAPILLTIFYPVNQMVIERDVKAFSRGVQAWKAKIQETLVSNWKIWPIATYINFYLMPMHYQVLFANFVGLFWNMILSYIASK